MRRRDLIAARLAAPGLAPARSIAQQQPAARMPRVGILTPASSGETPIFAAFKQALLELGYAEGRNIVLEFRLARGDFSLLPRLAAELVAEPVDVIVTDGSQATLVAGRATTRIPIVMGAGSDPVTLGLASGHSHPGGNVTGFTLMGAELNLKRLELLRTFVPNATTVAMLINPSNPISADESKEAARRMGLRIIPRVEPVDAEALLALVPSVFAGAAGVIVLPDPMFWNRRQIIISLINAARLPAKRLDEPAFRVRINGMDQFFCRTASAFFFARGRQNRQRRRGKPRMRAIGTAGENNRHLRTENEAGRFRRREIIELLGQHISGLDIRHHENIRLARHRRCNALDARSFLADRIVERQRTIYDRTGDFAALRQLAQFGGIDGRRHVRADRLHRRQQRHLRHRQSKIVRECERRFNGLHRLCWRDAEKELEAGPDFLRDGCKSCGIAGLCAPIQH
jgi:putative ABC transport system substrate-binding protein